MTPPFALAMLAAAEINWPHVSPVKRAETATSVRYQKAELELARRVIGSGDAIQQAEAIARHYVAHAQISVSILRLLELRRENEPIKDSDECIRMLVDQIKTDHATDFGIELEWPARENP